MEVEGDLLAEI